MEIEYEEILWRQVSEIHLDSNAKIGPLLLCIVIGSHMRWIEHLLLSVTLNDFERLMGTGIRGLMRGMATLPKATRSY